MLIYGINASIQVEMKNKSLHVQAYDHLLNEEK